MPYPWKLGDRLTYIDLNAAFANANAAAAVALTAAGTAQGLATSALTLGPPRPISVTANWPAMIVTNGTYVLSGTLPYNILVSSVDASIGTAGGVLNAQFRANGVTIGNLTNLAVSSPTKTNFAAVAGPSNPLAIGAGSLLDVVITVALGSPTDSYLCLNGFRTS